MARKELPGWPGVPDARLPVREDTFKSGYYKYAISTNAAAYVSMNEFAALRLSPDHKSLRKVPQRT